MVVTLDLRDMGAPGAPAIGGYAVEDLKEDALAVAGSNFRSSVLATFALRSFGF